MEPRRWLLTLLGCTLIFFGYQYMISGINFHHHGTDIEARVVFKETRDDVCSLRLRYSYNHRDYEPGVRLDNPNRYNLGDRVKLRILKDRPDVFALDYRRRNLEREIEIVLILSILYAAYRTTMTMISSVTPNQ